MKSWFVALSTLLVLHNYAWGQSPPADAPKEASTFTTRHNQAVATKYDLANSQDYADASRGLLAQFPQRYIYNAKGEVVWDKDAFSFVKGKSPKSVNPSLWRQEILNNEAGLFKVTEGIWQVRGYDIANMTLVAGKSGWIIIDPLLSAEVAKAALAFAQQQLGQRPVVAVIYTHSHVDHFGGVRGVVDEAEVRAGKVQIIAPEGFMDHAIAENVLAGNAMSRRAQYQFGALLSYNERGGVGTGLGKALSTGTIGLIPPTDIIKKTGEERVVDGVRIVFQMANGSEAPAEFTFYFPELKALCLSEVVTANLHNIYTLRGAKMRDALGWSKYINEMIDIFPEANVAFRSHHWPVWQQARIRQHLLNQRDAYRYIHDAALRMANEGKKIEEIGDHRYFPKALSNDFSTHGYYGTLSHNLRAVYAFYLGYYDGNPATLYRLPPQDVALKYVAAMGGAKSVLNKARQAFAAGEYRWAAELNNHLVFADTNNKAARLLQADINEQLGYQAESAVWRNAYLTAAQELRQGIKSSPLSTQGADVLQGMSLEMMFDFLAVRLDHEKLDGQNRNINLFLTDTQENYALELSNGVLNNTKGRVLSDAHVNLRLTRKSLLQLLMGKVTLPELLKTAQVKLEGDPQVLALLFANLKTFTPNFPIVTPN